MYPLVIPLLTFMAGITAGYYVPTGENAALILFGGSIALILCAIFTGRAYDRLVIIPFFVIGLLFINASKHSELRENHIKNLSAIKGGSEKMRVEGVLYRSPDRRKNRTRVYIIADTAILDGRRVDVSGKVLLTVRGNSVNLSYGDRVRFLARLKVPRNLGNPGEFDYVGYLKRRGIFVTGYIDNERWIVKLSGGRGWFWKGIETLRGSVGNFIDDEGLNNAPILKALLIGEKGGIDSDVRDRFARTGTAHILAISGLHIGIITIIVYNLVLALLRLSQRFMLAFDIRRTAALSTIPPILFYGLLAGFSLPTKRAVIMVMAFVAAILIGRARNTYNTLALAALIILVFTPQALFDPSFQLSFAALLAIFYLTPKLVSLIKEDDDDVILKNGRIPLLSRLKDKVFLIFFVSFSAALGTAPIVAYHFHFVSLLGVLSNLFIVPLIGFLVVPLGLSAIIFIPFWHGLASLLINIADKILDISIWIIGIFGDIKFSTIYTSNSSIVVILFITLLFISALSLPGRRHMRFIIFFIFLSISISYGWQFYSRNYSSDMRVIFISVGQGDSTLVEFPFGKRMLIDGGGSHDPDFDVGRRIIAPFLKMRGIGRIDYMVLSHNQADHEKGLEYIVKNFEVGEFWWNGDDCPEALYKILNDKSVPMHIKLFSSGPMLINGVRVEFLHPGGGAILDKNNSSLVVKIIYRDVSFLFPGDIEEAAEAELSKKSVDLKATVLKVPHHGSRTSSTAGFLKRVKPQIAVISVGFNNPFGFPAREVVKRYRALGTTVYRTDENGAVFLRTDGRDVSIRSYVRKKSWREFIPSLAQQWLEDI